MNKTTKFFALAFFSCLVLSLLTSFVMAGSSGSLTVNKNTKGFVTVGPVYPDPCGNGIIEDKEQCDGSSFSYEYSCASVFGVGYTGTLACKADCTIDTPNSNCVAPTTTPSTDTSGGSSGGGGGGGGGSSSSSSSSSGGGGGGSSSAKTCIENWECSNWTAECFKKIGSEEEIQSRSCTDANECGTTNLKPIEERACNVELLSQSKPGILGAIIGGGSTLGKLVIGFIIVVIIVLLIILLGRKSK